MRKITSGPRSRSVVWQEALPMKAVLTAASHSDASLIRDALERRGIPTSLIEARGYGGVPYTEVWVDRDEDSPRAVEAIRKLHVHDPNQCKWTCADCAEGNPDAFELCWKCGASRREKMTDRRMSAAG
ncbi:MAG: DUF2007 domain-containing protein [Lysobacterales bacterium]|nr:MAG: DUF2007 domain-containing protein [Xanthomonadales bacterium]